MSYEVELQEMQRLTGKISAIPQIDVTLTKEGCAADAKATGEAIKILSDKIDSLLKA